MKEVLNPRLVSFWLVYVNLKSRAQGKFVWISQYDAVYIYRGFFFLAGLLAAQIGHFVPYYGS